MQAKHVAVSLGLVAYGALLGWSITGDHLEAKMKSNQKMLGDVIDKKTRELVAAKSMLIDSVAMSPELPTLDEAFAGYGEKSEDVDYAPAQPPVSADGAVRYDKVEESVDDEIRGETIEETRSNLQAKIDAYTNDTDAKAFAEQALHVVTDSAPDKTPPFVISAAEYAYGEDGAEYNKIDLVYYPAEGTLLDDEGDPIGQFQIDSMVGWRNLNERFGDSSEHPDVVFIRNNRMETDFEIMRETDEPLPLYVQHGLTKAVYEAESLTGVNFRRSDAGD